MSKDKNQKPTMDKERKNHTYSHFELDPNITTGDIIKIGKITLRHYKNIPSAVANEIPIFLRWIEQIQSIFLEQQAISDRKIMLEMDKMSQEKLGTVLMSIIRQFSPDIAYMSILYYPDELDDETEKYQLVEHKIYEEKREMVVTRVSRFSPNIYKTTDEKKKQSLDITKMSILQHIGAKNIYTPLLIEKNDKNEKILSKFFLDYKGKGELFNYDKRLIARYPLGTVIYPFAITNRVKFIFELKFNNSQEQERIGAFIIQFLKHLRKTVDRVIRQSYVIRTCKGLGLLQRLEKRKDVGEIEYKKKSIIFMDIYEYSKLSIHINDKEKTYEENEATKIKFVNIFNLIVSEIVRNFEYSYIDKIVGDMHMIVLDENESLDEELSGESEDYIKKEKEKELARRSFLISWNIDLLLRSLNKKAKEIFEERDIDILDDDVYDKLISKNRDKSLKFRLLTYPKKKTSKFIYVGMEEFIYYYYICKKFNIKGLQVRIGFNIGNVGEVYLGGIRIDHTVIGKHVDLAARMEHLGRKNAVKFPARIYSLLDSSFKSFIIERISEESKLSNTQLTLKMVFRTKREYPKGYEKEGISTIEFFMEIGYAYYEAQKAYEKLEALFEELTPDGLYKRMVTYVDKHETALVESTRKANPKFVEFSNNDIKAYILTHKSTRLKIQQNIENIIKRRINKIIYDIKTEYDVYHIVRTLVLNRSYELYRNYFPNEALLSEHRKKDYFSGKIVEKITENMDFKTVEKDDLDRIVDELYAKLMGK